MFCFGVCACVHNMCPLSHGINIFFTVGCGQKATDLHDPEGLSSFRNVRLFSQSLTFPLMEPAWFLQVLPHTLLSRSRDFRVKTTKSQASVTPVEHLWEDAHFPSALVTQTVWPSS